MEWGVCSPKDSSACLQSRHTHAVPPRTTEKSCSDFVLLTFMGINFTSYFKDLRGLKDFKPSLSSVSDLPSNYDQKQDEFPDLFSLPQVRKQEIVFTSTSHFIAYFTILTSMLIFLEICVAVVTVPEILLPKLRQGNKKDSQRRGEGERKDKGHSNKISLFIRQLQTQWKLWLILEKWQTWVPGHGGLQIPQTGFSRLENHIFHGGFVLETAC